MSPFLHSLAQQRASIIHTRTSKITLENPAERVRVLEFFLRPNVCVFAPLLRFFWRRGCSLKIDLPGVGRERVLLHARTRQ
jgi:hypothetical protein